MCPTPNDFSTFRFDQNSNRGDYASHGDSNSGEYGPVRGQDEDGRVSDSVYPRYGYEPNNAQFTQDKSNEPADLARETAGSQNNFADLQQFLNNNLQTAGSRVAHDRTKPWEPPAGEGD